MTCPSLVTAAAKAAHWTASTLAQQLAPFAGSTTAEESGPGPARSATSTGAPATAGSSLGMAPEPATHAGRSSNPQRMVGRKRPAPSVEEGSQGSRGAALDLLEGIAVVLEREVDDAEDLPTSAYLALLLDTTTDTLDALRSEDYQ